MFNLKRLQLSSSKNIDKWIFIYCVTCISLYCEFPLNRTMISNVLLYLEKNRWPLHLTCYLKYMEVIIVTLNLTEQGPFVF